MAPPLSRVAVVTIADERALAGLADTLAAHLPPRCFVALRGDLGAGKTTFVKAVAAALGIDPEEVVSPTFGLIHEHVGPRGRLVHGDMYRLADPMDLEETGWGDAVAAAAAVFLEWPDRIGGALPAERIDIVIAIEGPTARTFTLTGHGETAAAVVNALKAACSVDAARPRLWYDSETMRVDVSGSLLCVIDVQERLLAAMPDAKGVVSRCRRLAAAARLLGVRAVLTEQYPHGLGRTPPELADLLPGAVEKMSFSCVGSPTFTQSLDAGVHLAVLAGLETHVCVAQTALDLLARGLGVAVCVDAVASRHPVDHETALRRLESSGAVLVTSEAVLFEWCGTAEHPRFQEIRRLVVDRGPGLTAGS